MKRQFAVIATITVAVIAGALIYFHHQQKVEKWNSAYQRARDAYKRASEYKNSGTLLYEPRFKDFEVALDDLNATEKPDRVSEGLSIDLTTCKIELVSFRDSNESANNMQVDTDKMKRLADRYGLSSSEGAKELADAKSAARGTDTIRGYANEAAIEIQSCVDKGSI